MQLVGVTGELAAIGGERQLVECALSRCRPRREEAHDVLAHQRLAPGEAQLADPEPDKGAAQPVELLELSTSDLGRKFMSSAMQ